MEERSRRSSGRSWQGRDLERIREALDPVALISSYTPLKRSGKGFVGLCPFHREKTPSFHVSPEGLFYCFGCKASGDLFRFIELKEGVSFPEAVRIAADFAGIALEPLPSAGDSTTKAFSREEGYKLLEAVARFYKELLLHHPAGELAREYLHKRGYPREFWQEWFGFAEEEKAPLREHLERSGFSLELAQAVGVLNAAGRERFSGRLLFAIRDERGRVAGFGARALKEGDQPKYLNSPDSPWFHKGQILYGFSAALPRLRREGTLILCEGYFDVLRFHFLGLTATVAPLGTALTPRQAARMAAHAHRVILALDNDAAGRWAAFRSFLLLFERGVEVRWLRWGEGKDPDEFLLSKAPEEVEALLAGAEEFLPLFLMELERAQTLEKRRELAEAIARDLAQLRDPLAQDLLVQEFARALQLSREALHTRVEKLRERTTPLRVPQAPVPLSSPPSFSEEILVQLLLRGELDRFQVMNEFQGLELHPWVQGFLSGEDPGDPAYASWLGKLRHTPPPRLKPEGVKLLLEELRIGAEERKQRLEIQELEQRLRESLKQGDQQGAEAALLALRNLKERVYG